MARDLNRIMQDVKNSKPVFITEDGRVEDAKEAEDNAKSEDQRGGSRPRTQLKPEVFGRGEEVVRVEAVVLDAMDREAKRHVGETGGIIVGPDDRIVTRLILSGPNARRTSASYELDVRHLQPLLEQAENEGLRFLGIWHSHPEGYAELSSTDRAAARSILRDPGWGLRGGVLLLPLSVRKGASFETEFFLAEGDRPEIRPARTVICSATTPKSDDTVGPWEDGGSFVGTAYGRARLKRDCRGLTSQGWTVTPRRDADGTLMLSAARVGVELLIILPREYPFGPPEVFRKTRGELHGIPHSSLTELAPWSSRRSLVVLAEQAARAAEWPRTARLFDAFGRAIL